MGGSILSSKNSHLLVLHLSLESEELFFLTPVTESLDEASKENSKVDGECFNPFVFLLRKEGKDEED